MLIMTGGTLKPKHRLRALVELLIANASGSKASGVVLGFSGKTIKRHLIPAFDPSIATEQLSALVNAYLDNLRQPMPFDEEIFQQYIDSKELDISSLASRRIIDGDDDWQDRTRHFIDSVEYLLTHGTGD
jgi:exonuclease V gamma subunit